MRKPVEKFVGDVFMENEPASGDARLALVMEYGEGTAISGQREIGVSEDHICALATELKLDTLEIASRSRDDLAPDGGRAGEHGP